MAGVPWEAIAQGISDTMSFVGNFGITALQNNLEWRNWLRAHDVTRQDYLEDREYNSPAAQMERYKAAGLNPNLIYGQQNTTSPMSGQAPPKLASYADAFSNSMSQLSNLFSFINELKNSAKQREVADSQIAANAARQRYFDSLSNLNTTKNGIETLRWTSFKKGNYYDKYVNNLILKNTGLDLNNQFQLKTFQDRVNIVNQELRFLKSRAEAQEIENVWNKPKSLLPKTSLYNMWKNRADQLGWRGSNEQQSRIDLNNASVASKIAQSVLYGDRSALSNTKKWAIPWEVFVRYLMLLK